MSYSALSPRSLRRRVLWAVAWVPWAAACAGDRHLGVDEQRRFRGIGLVLVVDAVPGAEMKRVVVLDDVGKEFYAKSLVSRGTREVISVGGRRVPLTLRAVWREGSGWVETKKSWNEGTIVGDYTIPVAERIPDAVLADIRSHGGALRLKFRLKPDGVLFGWDIERPAGGISKFDMPGGDFLETRY